jgi:excisionase family DNA binding protein
MHTEPQDPHGPYTMQASIEIPKPLCRICGKSGSSNEFRDRIGTTVERQHGKLTTTLTDKVDLDQEPFRAPLAIPPRQACQLLSVGLTRLYELLHAGELESYRHGRSRRITTASVRAYIARQIDASPTTWGPPP